MNYTSDLFIVEKLCIELITIFGWADSRTILLNFWIKNISFSKIGCLTVVFLRTKQICKQNWKETDLWCTRKQRFIQPLLEKCIYWPGKEAVLTLCATVKCASMCIMVDFQVCLYCPSRISVLPVSTIPQCIVYGRQLPFYPSGGITFIFFFR